MSWIVPFNRPAKVEAEIPYIMESLDSGQLSGDGPFTKRCHSILREALGVERVLLTTSCTHALEMSALLLDIKPGDEVIVPSFTFVSTVNAFMLRGAKPIFADVRPDTLNLDEAQLESLITPRTKAIVVVHYAGVGCEMDAIMSIASRHGIAVVEDNAHGLFGKYNNQFLGTFGCLSTQSFHETKNFSCGEGGALIINDEQFSERAEIIREKGTNRSKFFRGQVDKYSWVDIGSSYLSSDILAAVLCAQLEARHSIQSRRKEIWDLYNSSLQQWAQDNGIQRPHIPANCEQAYHMFYLLFPSLEFRQAFLDHLKGRGILSVFHYLPLHTSRMGLELGGRPGDCPVTESVSDRIARLPFFFNLTPDEQQIVIEATLDFAI